jgi:HSP20 family protein
MLPMIHTQNSIPGLFDRFLNDNWLDNFWGESNPMFSPSVNITETDKSYQVELAAPGIDKKDFNLNVENDRLTISYEHKEENEEKNDEKKFLRREFKSTSFSKSFTLPEHVNADKISAAYQNGVLQVTIPKEKEKSKLSRLIKIS